MAHTEGTLTRRQFINLALLSGAGTAATLFLGGCAPQGTAPVPARLSPTAAPPSPGAKASENPRQIWEAQWPNTPEQAAAKLGGTASQWQRNPEWPDTKTIDNTPLGIKGYVNREWRPTDPKNLPFRWPKNPQEAVAYFFPGEKIDPKFMQPAWIDPVTKLVTGWHLSEDHWLVDGSPADVTLMLHTAEVAEGYTVNGTLEHEDDRNWVAFGGLRNKGTTAIGGLAIPLPKGQGMTMWMPGTDPNAIALRMELFNSGDTPYYQGLNGEQLGPDAFNFTPVYQAANLINR